MNTALRDKVLATVRQLKQGPLLREPWLPVLQQGRTVAWLEPVTWLDADRHESIELLAQWRAAAAHAFPSQFPVTLGGTQRWVIRQLLEVPDRLLFWVTGLDGKRVGHVGLFRFDFEQAHVEADNIVRGVQDTLPGVMHASVEALLGWTFKALDMNTVFLRVFSDNDRAIRLYERCGFQETMRMPMARVVEGEVVRWIEVNSDYHQSVSRYLVTMRRARATEAAPGDRGGVAA